MAQRKKTQMTKEKITLSKTLKLPIENVAFSNKQVGITIEYDGEGFDIAQGTDEINGWLETLLEDQPMWMRSGNTSKPKEEEVKNG